MSELRSKGQVGNGKWEREKKFQRKCNFLVQKQEDMKQKFPCLLPFQLLCHSYSSVRGGTSDIWREVKLEKFNIWIQWAIFLQFLVTSVWSSYSASSTVISGRYLSEAASNNKRLGGQGLPKALFPEISFRNKYPVFKHRNSWSLSKQIQTLSNQKWNAKKPGSLAGKEKSLEIFDRFFSSEGFLMALLHWPLLGSLYNSSCEPRQTYEEAGQRLNICQNREEQTWWFSSGQKRVQEKGRVRGRKEKDVGKK